MSIFFPAAIEKNERKQFFQDKFDYYEDVFRWVVILICLAEVSYFVTDCQIFGRMAWEVLFPRCFVLLPMGLYLLYNHFRHDYLGNTIIGYLVMHASMWCTIWTIYYLPNRDFSREGFIVMHFGFLSLGLAAPMYLHTILHSILLLDIVVSNLFIHYEHFSMMITLGLPIYVGILLLLKILENAYVDHYLSNKKLEAMSTTDQLTQAYNRHILDGILESGTSKLKFKSTDSIWFLLIDVDFFKKINDNYGHEAGDRILIAISSKIRENIRENDLCLRWGGEEFVVILQNAAKEEAMQIGERIRNSISGSASISPKVTISVGVSKYLGADYHQAINDADKAMYYAKNHGRNQVVCVEDL
ncbi:MAG: GGDEF domain-containing protein [Lachnospiraceae bacterium]|nr:GGDEF domain-containing protein [Lachnospiraceae bacterium]